MTEREALVDLLEAVDAAISSGDWKVDGACDPDAAIQRARNVLEQPEPTPVAKNELGRIKWLVDDWPQNCLLYAEPPTWTPVEIGVDITSEGAHVVAMYLLPNAVRYVFYSQFHTAPQRPWVGLTDEEISILIRATHNTGSFVRAIEAKLKEKNT